MEWGFAGFKGGEFVVSTTHKENGVTPASNVKGYSEFKLSFNAHSHPGEDGTKGASYVKEIGGDKLNIIQMAHTFTEAGRYTREQFPKRFVYHPFTKTLYQYTPYNTSILKGKITNKTSIFKYIRYAKSEF